MQIGVIQTQLLCDVLDTLSNPPIPGTSDVNIVSVDGVAQTGADWTALLIALQTPTVTIDALPTMAFSQVSVGIAEVAIPTSNLASRKTISIKALAANGAAIYIGLTGVTALTGYELSAGDGVEFDCDPGVNLFAISASGTQKICTAEIA